jgi:3-phenylpropionate/cinnamic acid dioxygenase small subunit
MTTLPEVDLERACAAFLYREAEILDWFKYQEWLETCLHPELTYLMPTRVSRERAAEASEFSSESYHMKDTFGSMKVRVDRLLTEHAWAEDPPSRTRRLVTNLRVSGAPERPSVKSNIMLFRSQGPTPDYDLLVAERHDVLAQTDDGLRLVDRLVLLTHSVLGTPNLGVFV